MLPWDLKEIPALPGTGQVWTLWTTGDDGTPADVITMVAVRDENPRRGDACGDEAWMSLMTVEMIGGDRGRTPTWRTGEHELLMTTE